jgi:hypothetical protein
MAYTDIDKPSDYFNTKLYTGNAGGQAISGIGFQPDFLWIKARSDAYQHSLRDVIRGSTKTLRSNGTNTEQTQSDSVTSFDSDGFTLGADSSSFVNQNSSTYVSWNWKANGAGSANTDGSQSATVSVNTTAGFSIVKFVNVTTATTNTFGHGLSVAPKVIIMRSLDSAYNWDVYHHKIAISKRLILNSTSAESSSTYMNSTSPTNQVFTVKSDEFANNDDCIAYCFADVQGYSKVSGSYTGNGNVDGPFVYTGFKPAFVLIKNTNATQSWRLIDNKRFGYNVKNIQLYPNLSNAESTGETVADILSNGFKIRATDAGVNGSGNTLIYMAFAENPFTTSTGVPATAR